MSLIDANWFTEVYEGRTAFSVRYEEKMLDRQSEFQKIEVFQTEVLGRVLILAGCFMVTDKDSFIYHEMLVHPAMSILAGPRKVLVIGGGDGGAVTEAVKYPQLESIILCEIDPQVVSCCREYFPEVSRGLDDSRVTVVHEDGAAFVSKYENEFDLVLVDSTDPVGPGVALFEESFYRAVKNSLKKGGIAVFQTESPLFMSALFSSTVKQLAQVFGSGSAHPYLATIPTYPGALWSFTFCSAGHDPLREAPTDLSSTLSAQLRFYTPQVHTGAFALPLFVQRLL
jgi:spermidine synthase